MNLSQHIVFKKNLPWKDLFEEMKSSMIGLHTMKDEHFGIVVVELMAAGLVTVAHNSAGPKLDIVGEEGESRGFLAESAQDFAKKILYVLDHYEDEKQMIQLRNRARKHVQMFSDQVFVQEYMKIFGSFIEKCYGTGRVKSD